MDISLNPKYIENKGQNYGNLELNLLIEQLELLFFTPEGSVLGDVEFGMYLEKYLWGMNLSSIEMKQYIDRKISKYILYAQQYKIESQVRFIEGQITDTAFIDILIEKQPIFGVHINR